MSRSVAQCECRELLPGTAARSPPRVDAGLSSYLMLTNMPQAAASAAPVNTITGLSQKLPP